MAVYWLHYIDGERSPQAAPLEAADDRQAVRLAAEAAAGRQAELWSGAHVITVFGQAETRERSGPASAH